MPTRMVTGVTRNYSIALDDVRRVIDPKPGHRVIGVSLVLARGRTVLVADTAITEMPTARGAGRHRRSRPPASRAASATSRASRCSPTPPSAIRAGERSEQVQRGGAHPRPAPRRLRVRRRDGRRRRAQPRADGALSVLPPDRHGQRAGHAGVPLGLDLHQDAAGAGRRDGASARCSSASTSRCRSCRSAPRTPTSSTWRRWPPQYRGIRAGRRRC